jgi:iron complex outermembrane receptor protein
VKKIFVALIMVSQILLCSGAYAADGQTQQNTDTRESKTADGAKETASVTETKLGEEVVTATRTEKTVENVPGAVHVVTKQDIESRDVQTIDEALNTTPGVFDYRSNLMDTMASISVGGIPGANRTLVMKDGVPLNDAYVGMVMWGGLPVYDVERIEVVQGPFSSLYGGNAMGGVINIITKMPEQQEITLKSGDGSAWNRGEALDDLRREYVSYGGKLFGKLSLFASYSYDATNGYPDSFVTTSSTPPAGITGWSPTTDNSGNTQYLIGDYGNNVWWDDNITARARYEFSKDSNITANYMRTRNEWNFEPPHTYLHDTSGQPVYSYGTGMTAVTPATFLAAGGNGGSEQNIYSLSYETQVDIVKAKINTGLVDRTGNWYTSPGIDASATLSGGPGQYSDSPSKKYFADMQFTFPLLNVNVVTLGGTFDYGKADSRLYNLSNWQDKTSLTDMVSASGGEEYAYSFFAQDEIAILKNLTAYAGFRQDWWTNEAGYANEAGMAGYPQSYPSRSDSAFSPKFSLVCKPFDETTFRASFGKSFRPPTVYELYSTWSFMGFLTYRGNPNLNPETSTSWDIGVEQGLWKGAKVKADFFENFIHDLICSNLVSSSASGIVYEKSNAGQGTVKGITAEIEQKVDKWLRLFTNATFTDARINSNSGDPGSVGKRMTFMPDTMFNIGAELRQGPVTGSLVGNYVSKRFSSSDNTDTVNGVFGSYDPYFILNGKIRYEIVKQVALSFSIDNILDRHYFSYMEAPGRSWFTDLTIKF